MAGYSGTPLAKKLGVKDAQRTWRVGMPESVEQEIAVYGKAPLVLKTPAPGIEMAHLFVTSREQLRQELRKVLPYLAANGILWISWPKKRPGVATELTENMIRGEALPLDLVDIKVCAIDETWSGLKLMIRREKRSDRL